MRILRYTVSPEYDGRKLLHFLRGGAGCSYTLVRSLKTVESGICLNGKHARTIDRIKAGDLVELHLPDDPENLLEPCEIPVEVLYEDEDLIAFNKPYGMACHPAKSMQQGTLANVFAARIPGQPCRLLGRLDKDTTGVVLVAKNAFAAAALPGKIRKTYLAVAGGVLLPPDGMIELPIGQPDREDPRRMVLAEGRPAKTEYHVLIQFDKYALVRCILHTGRTHQIRVHLAHLGHPLLGDALYGGDLVVIGRQALHCTELQFVHPVTGKPVQITASMPKDMQKLLVESEKSWRN